MFATSGYVHIEAGAHMFMCFVYIEICIYKYNYINWRFVFIFSVDSVNKWKL